MCLRRCHAQHVARTWWGMAAAACAESWAWIAHTHQLPPCYLQPAHAQPSSGAGTRSAAPCSHLCIRASAPCGRLFARAATPCIRLCTGASAPCSHLCTRAAAPCGHLCSPRIPWWERGCAGLCHASGAPAGATHHPRSRDSTAWCTRCGSGCCHCHPAHILAQAHSCSQATTCSRRAAFSSPVRADHGRGPLARAAAL